MISFKLKTGTIFYLISSFLLLSVEQGAFSQETKIEKVGDKYYITHNGLKSEVNTSTITVKLKNNGNLEEINKEYTVLRSNKLGYIDLYVPKQADIEEYFVKLKESNLFDLVKYAEYGKTAISHNDPKYSIQQGYFDLINMDDAWNITTGSSNIKVAVLDTEIDWNHNDIGNGTDGYKNINASLGYNYIENTSSPYQPHSHGTGVAGIIGAKTNNSFGISGVSGGNGNSGTTIIPYCVGGENGSDNIDFSTVDDAIIDAVDQGAKVINMSFSSSSTDHPDVEDAIQYAYNHNVVLVAATGNDFSSSLAYPASNSQTISVGAVDNYKYRVDFSNYGYSLDLVAPGLSVYTIDKNNEFQYISGTSFAAPYVSGTIALMLSINPSLTPSQIRTILRNTATKIPYYATSGWNIQVGYGLLNAYEAVKAALPDIVGPNFICTSGTFSLPNLPSGFDIAWTYTPSNSAPFPILTSNGNQCTINNSYHYPYDGTLTAKFYKNGQLAATKTKHVISKQSDDFSVTYYQRECGYYNVSHPAIPLTTLTSSTPQFVHQGCEVVVTSPQFSGRTITYSGCTPEIWQRTDDETVVFSLPLGSGGIPFYIHALSNGDGGCNCNIELLFFSYSNNSNGNYSLEIESSEGMSTFQLITNTRETDGLNSTQQNENTAIWNIEVYSTNPVKKIYSDIVEGKAYSLNTAEWNKGIYVVNAIINGEKITNKFVVK